ncbi:4'-phosphopantetheinyl transferase superfamily protein [Mesorhizobium sp. M2A.F.Ca.ET.039.01.1.1]|uniref:4'-phosphopantetheinyl transferase family protein n=1 Tax=Mesorhizobium sp. M2A.F.Ca.ET.039.01.1.1 TaxID=2496746 RepID=UPI000FCC9784|nr:4'-phosphopantetheinyl transferase superfamily protein [Mesorhizobium sp. M2A.F.Ca.ET.039.01.1.1]RWX60347.1 4'-phosphopantetheinyl transferase superfamily protein [Mesorhizobium sp. M2A.F.Ca.ET.039.01.1.1]
MTAFVDSELVTLSARSRGFFTNAELYAPGFPNAILVRGRFDLESYTDDLFNLLALHCPASLSAAVTMRRAEFLAGRAMAHAALRALGQGAAEIPIGPGGAPLWPSSSAGSITHTRGHCACFAIASGNWRAGVDVEALASGRALDAILNMTTNEDERALIARQVVLAPDWLASLVFSAKETLFKALYPVARRLFGFDCAELRTTPRNGQLRLHLTQTICPELIEGQHYDIRFSITAGHVLTWLAVRDQYASM